MSNLRGGENKSGLITIGSWLQYNLILSKIEGVRKDERHKKISYYFGG